MGPEEKLFLGWLDYTEVAAGESGHVHALARPRTRAAKGYQAIKVNLPNSDAGPTTTSRPPEGDARVVVGPR